MSRFPSVDLMKIGFGDLLKSGSRTRGTSPFEPALGKGSSSFGSDKSAKLHKLLSLDRITQSQYLFL